MRGRDCRALPVWLPWRRMLFLINAHLEVCQMFQSRPPLQQAQNKLSVLRAHNDCVSTCILCYDDSVIVTASHDATVALWSAQDGSRREKLTGYTDRITDCTVDESYRRLLTVSWDKSVSLWDMSTAATQKTWSASASSLLLSCDVNVTHQLVVAAADSGHYHVWDVRSGQKVTTIKGHTNTVTCCRFDFGGMNLCTCSMDNTATVWDIRMWKHLLRLRDHQHTVSCCAFSHNNHWLLTGSWDKNLCLYNVADGTFRTQGPVVLSQHHGSISSCSFSKDDSLFVSAGYDANVNVWCNHTHQLRNTYKGHTSWIKDANFGKDKKWIVTGDKNGEVRLWDTEAGNEDESKEHRIAGYNNTKCQQCGEMFTPIAISRPHNLQLNNRQCLLCQCRTYFDFDTHQ